MRLTAFIAGAVALAGGTAHAADPTGHWRVEDGTAIVRIDNCRGALWGVVAWEQKPARDDHNPNPSLRGRPTLGSAVVINMRITPAGRWEGEIYNAKNGKTYQANLRLVSDNTLQVQGCVLGSVLCGGQNWSRVAAAGRAGDVCSRVSAVPGRSH